MGEAAKARRESHVRQNEAETDSNRRQQVEKQAREQLRPEVSICQQCGALADKPFATLGQGMRQC